MEYNSLFPLKRGYHYGYAGLSCSSQAARTISLGRERERSVCIFLPCSQPYIFEKSSYLKFITIILVFSIPALYIARNPLSTMRITPSKNTHHTHTHRHTRTHTHTHTHTHSISVTGTRGHNNDRVFGRSTIFVHLEGRMSHLISCSSPQPSHPAGS